MHCDTFMSLMDTKDSLLDADRMINLNKLKISDYLLQCFAMYVKLDEHDSPYEYCNKMIDRYYNEIQKYPSIIKPVYTYNDILENINTNLISSMLTVEEGGVIEGKLDNLAYLYSRGVRMMSLTWNYKNEIASPNMDLYSSDTLDYSVANSKDGLTEFGKDVVQMMNSLGMIIDCSHSSDKTFYDVIELSDKPIVCSHSCSRSVCYNVRNMTDDMLYKLKENNGVVGINFCQHFVTENDQFSPISDIVKHITYIRDLIGIDYIGLGSDFDGISNNNIELKDASLMNKLIEELKNNNYSNEDIDKITHKNVLRVFKENL